MSHLTNGPRRFDRIAQAAEAGYFEGKLRHLEGKLGFPLSSLTLDEAVQQLSSRGFALSSRSDKEAQFIRKKKFRVSPVTALGIFVAPEAAGTLTSGVMTGDMLIVGACGVVLYALWSAIWYLARRDEVLNLRLTSDRSLEVVN